MRPASFIGPVLLILIGMALLARNILPDLHLAEMVARYWPLLLILWGILRLTEILSWAANGRPLPRHGISGGEWVLVLVLWMLGGSMHAWYTHRGTFFFTPRIWRGMMWNLGEPHEYQLAPITRSAGPSPRVVIDNFQGNVHINGSDQDSVVATGRKTIRAYDDAAAERANSETPLEVTSSGGTVTIHANQNHAGNDLSISEDLDITVPHQAHIEAHGQGGDFDLSGVGGGVEITSDRATVHLDNVGGSVHLALRRGGDLDIENVSGPVDIHGEFLGSVQLRKLAGQVQLAGRRVKVNLAKLPGQAHLSGGDFSGSGIDGPIHLESAAGDVQLSGFTEALDLNLTRGDIRLRPGKLPLGPMQVHTRSGDIELTVPEEARFELNLSTGRGEANNEYGAPLEVSGTGHRSAAIRGSVGGGPLLNLETGRGSVTVEKAKAEDLRVERE